MSNNYPLANLNLHTFSLPELQHPNKTEKGLNNIAAFPSKEEAMLHLTNHVLTADESLCWSIIFGDYEDLVGAKASREGLERRKHFLGEVQKSKGASAQALYYRFVDEIRLECLDALNRGWFLPVEEKNAVYLYGTSGLFVVIRFGVKKTHNKPWTFVLTAYIPGHGDPSAVKGSKKKGKIWSEILRESPLTKKEQRPRRGRVLCKRKGERRSQRRRSLPQKEQKYKVTPNGEEALYYEVFRPSLNKVRDRTGYDEHNLGLSRGGRADFHRMRSILPSSRKAKLSGWQDWRKQRKELE